MVQLPKGGSESLAIEITGEPDKLAGTAHRGAKEAKLDHLALDGQQLSAVVPGEKLGWTGLLQLSVALEGGSVADVPCDRWVGSLAWADGRATERIDGQEQLSAAKPEVGNQAEGQGRLRQAADDKLPKKQPASLAEAAGPPDRKGQGAAGGSDCIRSANLAVLLRGPSSRPRCCFAMPRCGRADRQGVLEHASVLVERAGLSARWARI